MSIDRRVGLKLSLPDAQARAQENFPGRERETQRKRPDEQLQQHFAAAMAAGKKEINPSPEAAQLPATFYLYQSPVLSLSPASENNAPQADLAGNLVAEVDRLLIADGSNGNRQIRLDLKDELLPGVSVSVQENEGRWQIDFVCRNDNSRLKLNRALPDLAATLAQRLRRDVLMRVQTDDAEDPCLQEALASF